MNGIFRILYQDAHCVAIDKPAGFWVHQAEEGEKYRVPPAWNCMRLLRNQLGQYVYPIHRLDRATSGVLVFGLTQEFASGLGQAFMRREVRKMYVALVRGWWPDSSERIETDDGVTRFECAGQTEWPEAVGRYSTCRYSLVYAYPETGRRHQIRRHCNHAAHPIVGDTLYGDRDHNRFFRDQLKWPGLYLKALELEFSHPVTGALVRLRSRYDGRWHRVFDRFGICPYRGTKL